MKLYANSLVGVGVASSLYHSSRGKLRSFLRWVDYTMIATATVVSNWLNMILPTLAQLMNKVHIYLLVFSPFIELNDKYRQFLL